MKKYLPDAILVLMLLALSYLSLQMTEWRTPDMCVPPDIAMLRC